MATEFNEFPHRLFLDREAYRPQYKPVSTTEALHAAEKKREETIQRLAEEMMEHLVKSEIIPTEES